MPIGAAALFAVSDSGWMIAGAAVNAHCGAGYHSLSSGCDLSFVAERQTNQEDVKNEINFKKSCVSPLI